MKKTIVVTGIPGSGKTTVCMAVQKLGKKAGVNVNIINYGTVMVETFARHGKAVERDAMRKADLDFQRKLQEEAAKTIAERTKPLDGITIIDTHMSIKTSGGYLPGLPNHVLQALHPHMFVLVEAKPSEIASRRMKDVTRKRDSTVEDAVNEELMFSRFMAGACAVLTGASVKIVINAEGRQEEAAKEILKALEVSVE